jgi:Mg-chelatase subunit ChlD
MDADYGGTELRSALEYTFENKTKEYAHGKPIPVAVFVLTDGETEDTSNIATSVSQAVAKAERENRLLRVFVLGIGDSVSTDVCEEIARAGKGFAVYVGVSASLVQSVTFFDNWISGSWHSPWRSITVAR